MSETNNIKRGFVGYFIPHQLKEAEIKTSDKKYNEG
jgi:hypothetical protein